MNTDIVVALIGVIGTILVAIISVTLPILYKRLGETNKRVGVNENILNDLIAYKPGAVAYGLLVNIKNRDNVPYHDDDADQKRCLNLLLDDGYLKPASPGPYIQFSKQYEDIKLCEIVSLTPISEKLIRLREILSNNRNN